MNRTFLNIVRRHGLVFSPRMAEAFSPEEYRRQLKEMLDSRVAALAASQYEPERVILRRRIEEVGDAIDVAHVDTEEH